MSTYVVRRLLQSVFVLVGVTFLVYFILFQTGDPTFLSVSTDASQQEVERVRHQLGFDRPWYIQYAEFLSKAVRGDFGTSLRQGVPVTGIVLDRIPATLELAITALVISLVVAFPVGILAATRRNTFMDQTAMLAAVLGQSAPTFFVGIMLLFIFGGMLGWFPIGGRGQAGPGDELRHLILPAVTLATFSMARNARLIRSSLLETLGLEYVTVAWAKGLAEPAVILRHALRNALIPVITVIGLDFGALLGGAIITETVFAWPGVGNLVVKAIGQKDFPVVVGCVTMLAVVFIVINVIVDVIYGYIDPRIRRA
ncbi:MAG: ABC transporter permease [Chloroflexi bacterium]|nr:ABC transporter permease [Chloroflexota bacterium]MBV9135301.1 ABC transporter permease [Chloroflexota bacterium]MBV9897404.1 ABC transporter permease [Chloroflexota bacterium]